MTDPAAIPEGEPGPTTRAAMLDLEAEIVRLQGQAETLHRLAGLLGEESLGQAYQEGHRRIAHASALLAEASSVIDTARRLENRFTVAWGHCAGPGARSGAGSDSGSAPTAES